VHAEAALDGGPIALVEDGDVIVIDAEAATIEVEVDADRARRAARRMVRSCAPGDPWLAGEVRQAGGPGERGMRDRRLRQRPRRKKMRPVS
jgi:dihydroxyacid dehydratase/phosphogluconate dehydratase